MPKMIRKAGQPAPTPTPVPPVVTMPPAQEPEEPTIPKPPDDRVVVYNKITLNEYSTTSELGPLTIADIVNMLGWETEKEYQARMVHDDPDSKPDHWLFGEVYHCLNAAGEKVRCAKNANNRPFDMGWCEELIHTVLHGHWAGPLMVPGETVNGETIRISRYDEVLSGQHSLTAHKLADEWLQVSRKKEYKPGEPQPVQRLEKFGDCRYQAWDGHEHVVMETIVITGLSDDERVLRTVDYVKPRTESDMFYTMDTFKSKWSDVEKRVVPTTPTDRKEMTRMLSAARSLLWSRTDTKGYETHPEVIGFLERHKKLFKFVEHIFLKNTVENGRKISKLHISAGHAAALCYLMGCSGPKTDGDLYRWASPPSENGLDWSYMDKAMEFWTNLAERRDFIPVRLALGRLIHTSATDDDKLGLGGRLPEKLAIIAKAWEVFKDHPAEAGECFTDADFADGGVLSLSYNNLDDKGNTLPDGEIKLLDIADFNGIDCPKLINKSKSKGGDTSEPPAPTKEEIERGTEAARAARKK